jgi:hypothetical protein
LGGGGSVGEKVGRNKEFFGLLKKDMCTFGTIVWFGEDTYVYSVVISIKSSFMLWAKDMCTK